MNDTYLTIEGLSEGLYKGKGSKFIAYAIPANSEETVKENLEKFRKKHYDASHVCYAFVLGKGQEIFRANDAGEPKHSAGDPILGQIRSNKLTNVLIIVVRYFGGTKLGVSGLINAYKEAAAEAILNNKIVEKVVKEQIVVNFPYTALNEVMRIVKDFDMDIVQQNFQAECQMLLLVRLDFLDQVSAIFENMPDVNFGMNA